MSDAEDRYWESQIQEHGPNALPGIAGVDWEAVAAQYAGQHDERLRALLEVQ
jgi:hypothetical protein